MEAARTRLEDLPSSIEPGIEGARQSRVSLVRPVAAPSFLCPFLPSLISLHGTLLRHLSSSTCRGRQMPRECVQSSRFDCGIFLCSAWSSRPRGGDWEGKTSVQPALLFAGTPPATHNSSPTHKHVFARSPAQRPARVQFDCQAAVPSEIRTERQLIWSATKLYFPHQGQQSEVLPVQFRATARQDDGMSSCWSSYRRVVVPAARQAP